MPKIATSAAKKPTSVNRDLVLIGLLVLWPMPNDLALALRALGSGTTERLKPESPAAKGWASDARSSFPPEQNVNLQESEHTEPKQNPRPRDCVLQHAGQQHFPVRNGAHVRVPESILRNPVFEQANDATDSQVEREERQQARKLRLVFHAAQRFGSGTRGQ